jgi:cytoskeletal protein RodZ
MLTGMNKHNHESGFGVVELALIVVIIAVLGAGGWLVYKNQKKATPPATSTTTTNTTTEPTTNTPDPTANWKKVDSIGGAYSIKVPDGWELTNYPDNVLMGDSITFSAGKPAVITTASSAYAGDQKRFNVGFTDKRSAQDAAPQ